MPAALKLCMDPARRRSVRWKSLEDSARKDFAGAVAVEGPLLHCKTREFVAVRPTSLRNNPNE
jgi:hypothetical protein